MSRALMGKLVATRSSRHSDRGASPPTPPPPPRQPVSASVSPHQTLSSAPMFDTARLSHAGSRRRHGDNVCQPRDGRGGIGRITRTQ